MKKIMLFFAVACILAACNNDNEVLNEPQYITEFKADFGGADTRMTADASTAGLKFAWEDGDALYVYDPDDENENYTDYTYNSSTGKFEKLYDTDPGMIEGKTYFAISQVLYNDSYTSVDGDFAVKTQLEYGNVSAIPLISDVFTADAECTIAAMHHTVGVVEVPVKLGAESTISELGNVCITVEGAKVTGQFYATPKTPYYAGIIQKGNFDVDSYAYQSATLNKSTSVSFFIPMLPGTYENPELWYYNENGDLAADIVKFTGRTLTIERGMITKMPEQVLTLN